MFLKERFTIAGPTNVAAEGGLSQCPSNEGGNTKDSNNLPMTLPRAMLDGFTCSAADEKHAISYFLYTHVYMPFRTFCTPTFCTLMYTCQLWWKFNAQG